MSVPLGAIDDEGAGPGVWLLDRRSSSVSYRPVRFIRFDGERAIVGGDIHVGDPIIAIGGHFLHEGQRVQVTERALRESRSTWAGSTCPRWRSASERSPCS